jgi:hypothetical protein
MARVEPPTSSVMRPRLIGRPPQPAELGAACGETGRFSGEIVRDALRRQLQLMRFERLRRQALPYGEAAGWLTEGRCVSGCLLILMLSEHTQACTDPSAGRLLPPHQHPDGGSPGADRGCLHRTPPLIRHEILGQAVVL